MSKIIFLSGVFLGFVALGITTHLLNGSPQQIKKQGYKQGQIDAQNGIIKIHKQTQPDSSVVWVWKEETK